MFNHNVALINLEHLDNEEDCIFFVHNSIKYKIVLTRGYNKAEAIVYSKDISNPREDDFELRFGKYKFVDKFTFELCRCEMIYIDLHTGDIGPVNPSSLQYTFMKEDTIPPVCRDVKRKDINSYLKQEDVKILRMKIRIDGTMQIFTKKVCEMEQQFLSERSFEKGEQICLSYPDEGHQSGVRTEILTVI